MNFKNRITSGATQQANGMSRTKSNVNDAVDKIQHESKDIMTHEIYAGADGTTQNEEVNTTTEMQVETTVKEEVTTTPKNEVTEGKRILGMKPLHFGIGVVAISIVGYLIYKDFNKKGVAKVIK
ncbi:MAG: hypothetical protein PHT69_02835 [Bacteroidales bacterium]|nr:hypothetical protein [Bacteroidales bacterium]